MKIKQSADVVIVGAGFAGCQIAQKLAKKGIDVLVLEAGPRVSRSHIVENFRNSPYKADFQSPYPPAAYALHPQYSPDNNYLVQKGPQNYPAGYLRLVGGTTYHWAGMAWRMIPDDLRMYTKFGVGRDWPISYEDLEPYYYEAEVEMGVGGPNSYKLSPRNKPYPHDELDMTYFDKCFKEALTPHGYHYMVEPAARNSKPFDGRPACAGNNNCMPICPIGAQYTGDAAVAKAEKAGAVIIPNAVVYKIDHDNAGAITSVLYKSPDGSSHNVKGKIFVIAANGIETPKLLLISASSKYPNGIANSSDQVGRNLMDHPGTSIRFLSKTPMYPGRGPMEVCCISNFMNGEFRSDHSSMKLNISNFAPAREVTELLLSRGIYGAELNDMIRDFSSRWVAVSSMLDILPNPQNRITASREHKDMLGIPYPEVHYAIDDYTRRGAKVARQNYTKIADIMEASEILYSDGFSNNNHIMGTVIMGDDPKNSVVDKDLKCYDHPNLYIASSGVMASAGCVNCTLTESALCMRLADTIINKAARI